MIKTAAVETPQSRDDPTDIKVEEIPLPPPEMWGELENSGKPAPTEAAAPVPRVSRPIERLAFVAAPTVTVPLQYPFVREGGTVDSITVRRLTVGEVGDVLDSLPPDFDNHDIYAVMTGLPAPVLRGLVDVDGDKVMAVAYDFLPLVFRPADIPTGPTDSSST